MAELTPREKLQPSLLDRLIDEERSLATRVEAERNRLLARLNDDERQAFDDLFDVERRDSQRLTLRNLKPFARHDRGTIELLEHVVAMEQQRRFEANTKRVMSLDRIKASVLRDINWLFNTEYAAHVHDFGAYPHAKRSVVNYGIPAIVGLTLSDLGNNMKDGLAKTIKQALLAFEPRLDPDSIKVTTRVDREQLSQRAVSFEVQAVLMVEPAPLRLSFVSVVDLETGDARIQEEAT